MILSTFEASVVDPFVVSMCDLHTPHHMLGWSQLITHRRAASAAAATVANGLVNVGGSFDSLDRRDTADGAVKLSPRRRHAMASLLLNQATKANPHHQVSAAEKSTRTLIDATHSSIKDGPPLGMTSIALLSFLV